MLDTTIRKQTQIT